MLTLNGLKMLKKKKLSQSKAESPEEQYWNQADLKARQLIIEVFDHPLIEATYAKHLAEYQNQAEIPDNPNELAQELAYEYCWGVCESILAKLSQFTCHNPEYFKDLIQSANE
jgi:hypothetical protein